MFIVSNRFPVFVRTEVSGPVGQLCVFCSSIRVVMLLENCSHDKQENQLHCFQALKTLITTNYCQELHCFIYSPVNFALFSGK